MPDLEPWELNRLVTCNHPDCKVDPGSDWEPPSDHALAAELVRHLYDLDGCNVGGPLHVALDDENVEDGFWVPEYRGLQLWPEDTDPDGSIRLAEIRRTTDRICEVMLRLSEDERVAAIEAGRPPPIWPRP